MSANEVLYHFQVYIPPALKESTIYRLRYSKHATNAALQDRYCCKMKVFKLPEVLNTEKALLVEVGLHSENQVSKRVYRTRANSTLDLVLVVLPDGLVKTVWFNSRSDRHPTLDRSRYALT